MSAPARPTRVIRTAEQKKRINTIAWVIGFSIWFLVLRQTHGTYWLFVAGLGIFGPLLYTAAVKAAVKRYDTTSKPALEALARGEAYRAEEILRAIRASRPWPKILRNLTSYNLALAIHRQGRHAEAVDLMMEAERGGGAVHIDPAIASTLSLFYACLGDVPTAETWHAEALLRYRGRAAATAFPALIGELGVMLRRGQYAEVQARLDRDWGQIEHTSKGETLRPVKLFRAFAVAQAAGVREASAAAPFVESLHPVRPGEFDYLATSWPELRDFLVATLPQRTAA